MEGYYNSLLALFDKGVEEGFIDSSARHIVVIADTAEELIRKIEVYIYISYVRKNAVDSVLVFITFKHVVNYWRR